MADANGCHREQYSGEWAIEPKQFDRLVGLANQAIVSGYLSADHVQARREALAGGTGRSYSIDAGGVARIDISGPMTKYENSFQSLFGGTSTVRARQQLREAARDPDVRSVLLVIDSPGGTVAGTNDLGDEVARTDARKPVYAYYEDLAASGAVMVGVRARRIFANQNALVGSIGVFSTLVDSSEAAAKAGYRVHVVSTAPLKGAKAAGLPITDASLADEQRVVNSLGDMFVATVAQGRRMSDEQARSLATGQVWIASEAVRLGLVDEIATLDEATRALQEESMSDKALAAETTAREAAEKERDQLRAEVAQLKAAAPAAAPADPLAGLGPEARARIEAAEKKAKDSDERLAKLEAEQLEQRFTAEVRGFDKLGLDVAAVAGAFKAIHQAAPDALEPIRTAFKAANEQAATGATFDVDGKDGAAGTGTAAAQIAALAAEYVKDGKAKTVQQATSLVMKARPELAKQHLAEQRGN